MIALLVRQFINDAIAQHITVVQATDNKGLDLGLRGVFRRAPDNRPKLSQLVVTASTDCGDAVRQRQTAVNHHAQITSLDLYGG